MSTSNIKVECEKKKPQRGSWFSRRRRSLFSSQRIGRYGSRRKPRDTSSTSSGEALSTVSNESSKSNEIVPTSVTETRGASIKKTENEANVVDNASDLLECPLCLNMQTQDNFPSLSTCHHRSCMSCLRQYLTIEISESRVNLMCPECQEKLHPTDVRLILENEPHLIVKWEEFSLRRALSNDPDCRWCPAPDCGYAVIAYGCASCPRLKCERQGCNTEFCYHCRQEWHNNQTCDSAHLQRTRQLRVRSSSTAYSQGSFFHDEIKPCPKCGALIVKMNDGSCNHMTCTVCEAEFCWLCLQKITDLHYLSPSGCTFWGKKPWSRKKKILWQLGLLIGAPLGIALVAGVAVPGIILGLPIWVGRKLSAMLETREMSKAKKCVIIASCVVGSAALSPVLAAVAVGVGVPVMLFYIYGVVPFSLCRTGGYGAQGQALNAPGASMLPSSLLFDLGVGNGQPSSSAAEEGTSFHGQTSRTGPANPSIGEASVGGVTMGSFNTSRGSNIDKIGRIDLDVASTLAMAGTSITGSISGVSALNTNRCDAISKDLDQHSTHTQVSVGSIPGVAAVQVHMSDNVSEQSFASTSHPPAHRPGSSLKFKGGKRVARLTARSTSLNSNPTSKIDSQGLSLAEDNTVVTIETESPSQLSMVDEQETCRSASMEGDFPTASSSAATPSEQTSSPGGGGSESGSCDSASSLIPGCVVEHSSSVTIV